MALQVAPNLSYLKVLGFGAQASRQWNKRIDEEESEVDLLKIHDDHAQGQMWRLHAKHWSVDITESMKAQLGYIPEGSVMPSGNVDKDETSLNVYVFVVNEETLDCEEHEDKRFRSLHHKLNISLLQKAQWRLFVIRKFVVDLRVMPSLK
ncbi:hypothetical protein Tco_0328658 [Tanacetum coccineum]